MPKLCFLRRKNNMKKLILFFTFIIFSLNLLAQTEQVKQEEIYTKDFLNKFATALYLEKEDPQEALKLYEELFEKSPKEPTLLETLSKLCFKIQNKECSQKYVPLYLEIAPEDPQALALNAQLAWQQGNLKEAQEYYSQALKIDNQNQALLTQYLTLLNAIDKDEAINFLKQLEVENNLLYLPINLEIAQIYLNQNQADKAQETLDSAIKKYPQTREFYLAKIRIYESQKDIENIFQTYMLMEKEGILYEEDLVKIGAYLVLQNKPLEAKKYYERAYQQNPSNPFACEFLSLWEQNQKNYLQAEEYLKQSSLFDTNSALRVKQAHLLKLAGEDKKALLAMEQAYKDFNESLEIGFYYSLILSDNKENKKALKVLEKLLEKQPDNEEFLINAAYNLAELKDYKKMAKVLEQTISINPKNAQALNFLGYYLVDKTKQLERGGEYIKRSLELNPKDSATIDSLAWYFYKKGDFQQALKLLESLPAKDKKDAEILFHFAKVNESLGNKEAALKYYQALLSFKEYSKPAQKAIKKISK